MGGRITKEIADAQGVVEGQTFILATRDAGYRGVATAVAELVDNSLQAGASEVRVLVTPGKSIDGDRALTNGSGVATIAVVDNGIGMDPASLRRALRFGGTNRFDDRSGLGRFGMGLPNSSVSQSRRLEIYSWQNSGTPYYTYLDVDEVATGRVRDIPTPVQRELPLNLSEAMRATGTAVVWSRCDRLGRLRPATIAQRLRAPLGQMYRYALWSGVKILVNGIAVQAVDPLFLRGASPLNEATPFGPRLHYEFRSPLTGTTSFVDIQFTELPVANWHAWTVADKRRHGVVGGAGVSIVRAGREIEFGWHLMGTKRRENYDDWWRCEIAFSPALDELFGVTHNKQGISPTPELQAELGTALESIARTLNARVRTAFVSLNSAAPTVATALATKNDRFLGLSSASFPESVGGLRYQLQVAPLNEPTFYQATMGAGLLTVTLNSNHHFYTKLYEPACLRGRERERFSLESLILTVARVDASVMNCAEHDALAETRIAWSDALSALLDRVQLR